MTSIPGLAELEAAKQLLLASLAEGIATADVIPALQQLEAFRNSLCQADHLLIHAAEEHGLPEQHCVSSVEKLVAQVLRISYGDAKRRVRAAAALAPRRSMSGEPLPPLRPELAAAQAAGEVSAAGADLILHTLGKVDVIAPALTADTETLLVGYGRTFEPGELGKICDRVLDHIDPDGTRPRDQAHRDRRALHLGRCRDGMIKLEGRLTPAAGARVKAVLGPLAAPRPTLEPGPNGGEKLVPDDRSTEQRHHDALDEACARLLRAGDVPASGGTPATVIITMSEDQLPRRPRSGLGDEVCGTGGPDPAFDTRAWYGDAPFDALFEDSGGTVESSTGEVLSIAEALRLAAEADVVSVVMTGAGRPLHLGRTKRYATPSQTFALIARDGGCSFPGCTVPPEWCERHHIVPWHLGGPTDVDNLTLLCGYHHAYFARAGWTCFLNADGLPAWAPPHWQRRGREPLVNHRIVQRHETPRRAAEGRAAPARWPAAPTARPTPLPV